MIFLIEFDRRKSQLVTFRGFPEDQRRQAHEVRLSLELERNREGVRREIVLLDAASKKALHETHRRYFEPLEAFARTG